jgi:hypothetical protein
MGFFFRDTLSENQNWMIQMRDVRDMGPFQGYTVRKSNLNDKDERCQSKWAFFRDTQLENQN